VRLAAGIALALLSCAAAAVTPATADGTLAQGARDGDVPAWTILAATPAGWTRDCCTYARAIGVDAVLYRGEWSGEPQRVMVLNVWPRALPSLDDDVQADRQRYRQHDPAGKVDGFVVRHPSMRCEASIYQGSDRIDDVLVFCEPPASSGVRLSWSMTLDADDASRRALLDDFMRVVVGTRYKPGAAVAGHAG